MYLILGVRIQEHVLLGIPPSARDAVEQYEAALKQFDEVLVEAGGEMIGIEELKRRAAAEPEVEPEAGG